MAISLRAAGTPVFSNVANITQPLSPQVPASAAAGDLSILLLAMKPYNATFLIPSGWSKIGEATNGTVATGTDVGSTKIVMFAKESATPGVVYVNVAGPTLTSYSEVACAVIHTFSQSPFIGWNAALFTSGGDSTQGIDYSATGAAGIDVAANDVVVWGAAINSDAGTPSAITLGGMGGATLGTAHTMTNATTALGDDARIMLGSSPITAGSSSAVPTLTYTNASNSSGTSMWLRLREAVSNPIIQIGSLQTDTAYLPPSPPIRIGGVQTDVAYLPPSPPVRIGGVQVDVAYIYAPQLGPTVKVWNGTAEIATNVFIWNNPTEVPASVSQIL